MTTQITYRYIHHIIFFYLFHYRLNGKFFNFEITETAAVQAGELLDLNMSRLKSMGCGFSMDDFGTGYSNLSQMANTGFDIIKLDKQIIWDAFKNSKAGITLEYTIKMLNALNLFIVAEGVETDEQVQFLKDNNCDVETFTSTEIGRKWYKIDDMAELALHNRISKIQRLDQATTLTQVKEIVDEAIDREAHGGLKKAISILTAKRYTEDDKIVLTERNFE